MNSSLFKLNLNDTFKGAVAAVFSAVVLFLYQIVSPGDFNFFEADWGAIFSDMLRLASATFLGYLVKNLLSDQNGDVLGMAIGWKR